MRLIWKYIYASVYSSCILLICFILLKCSHSTATKKDMTSSGGWNSVVSVQLNSNDIKNIVKIGVFFFIDLNIKDGKKISIIFTYVFFFKNISKNVNQTGCS